MALNKNRYTARHTTRPASVLDGETIHPERATLIRVEGSSPENAAAAAIDAIALQDPRLDTLSMTDREFTAALDAAIADVGGRIEIFSGDLATIPEDHRPLHIEDRPSDISRVDSVDERPTA